MTFHTSVSCFKLEKQQKVLEKDSELYMSLKNQMGSALEEVRSPLSKRNPN